MDSERVFWLFKYRFLERGEEIGEGETGEEKDFIDEIPLSANCCTV